MAKKPKQPVDGEAHPLELDEVYTAEPLSAALENLYSELDIEHDVGQVQVFISKIDAATGKEARVWQGSPIDYDLHALAKRFGSAEYRVKVFVPNPNGRLSQRGNKVFKMELDPADDARIELLRKGVAQPQAPAMTPESIAAMIAQAVKQAMPAAPVAAPVVNPLEIIRGLAEVMKTMQPPAPQGVNGLDALRAAAGIFRELRGNDDDEPLRRGVNASGMDVFMKLIDKFAPALLAASGQPLSPNPPLSASAEKPAIAAPAPVSVTGTEDDEMLKFKMGLAFLVAQAQAGNDPQTYAEMILDNVPEADVEIFLQRDDWLEYLAGFEPRVKNYPVWFVDLRNAVIELRQAENDDPPPNNSDGPAAGLTAPADPGKTH